MRRQIRRRRRRQIKNEDKKNKKHEIEREKEKFVSGSERWMVRIAGHAFIFASIGNSWQRTWYYLKQMVLAMKNAEYIFLSTLLRVDERFGHIDDSRIAPSCGIFFRMQPAKDKKNSDDDYVRHNTLRRCAFSFWYLSVCVSVVVCVCVCVDIISHL